MWNAKQTLNVQRSNCVLGLVVQAKMAVNFGLLPQTHPTPHPFLYSHTIQRLAS